MKLAFIPLLCMLWAVCMSLALSGCSDHPMPKAADLIPQCQASAPASFAVDYHHVEETRAKIAQLFAERGWTDINAPYGAYAVITANCRLSSQWRA